MSTVHRLVSLLITAGAAALPSDQPVTSRPVLPIPAAVQAAGDFVLFGWLSPPPPKTNAPRIAELAGAGMSLALPAWADSGVPADNLTRLGLALPNGIRCILWDRRFESMIHAGAYTPEGQAIADSIVAAYAGHPAFFGYYLGDEPGVDRWPMLDTLFDVVRTRDASHPPWNNLFGRMGFKSHVEWEAYTLGYLERFHPAVLCNDHYEFRQSGDRGQFFENLVGLNTWSRAYGIPFWVVVQLVQHADYRALTQGELRWQVSMALAYGARGIGYFTYWTPDADPVWNWHPAVIDTDGTRTAWYPILADWNRRVRAAGETLETCAWQATQHAGGSPPWTTPFAPDSIVRAIEGRAVIARYASESGMPYVIVANCDSASSRTIGITLAPDTPVSRQVEAPSPWQLLTGSPTAEGMRYDLTLDAGAFALLRLGGNNSVPGSPSTPGLSLAPNPAHRELRMSVTRAGNGAILTILDAAGRRVWSHAVSAGDANLVWRGEREDGGTARPGFYVARLADDAGVAVRRFQWLGNP